jgi:hypothetical protein
MVCGAHVSPIETLFCVDATSAKPLPSMSADLSSSKFLPSVLGFETLVMAGNDDAKGVSCSVVILRSRSGVVLVSLEGSMLSACPPRVMLLASTFSMA